MRPTANGHTYRLKLEEDACRLAREIEFEAPSAHTALRMAHHFCGARPMDFFQDGQKLAKLQACGSGLWKVG